MTPHCAEQPTTITPRWRGASRQARELSRGLQVPVVTLGLVAAVLSVALHYGVVRHELPIDVAARYAFSGRGIIDGDWHSLITSQLLTRDAFMTVSIALSLLVMLGGYESIAGHRRAALVAVVSAVSGPVLTTGSAGLLSALGSRWAGAALSTLDYGASAITAGAGGALVGVLGNRRLRIVAALWVAGGLLFHHQLADWEHLFSFTVGFGLGVVLGRPSTTMAAPTRPTGLRLAAAAGFVSCLAAAAAIAPSAVPVRRGTTVFGAQAIAYGVPDGATLSPPRLVQLAYASPALGTSRTAYVLLPPGYDESTVRYPVVEMLHGSPGAPIEMFDRLGVADAEQSGRLQPFIAVAPDGNLAGGAESDFADTPTARMGTSVSVDLRTAIDSGYRTDGHWGVMGISAGGFGASYLATTRPDLYQAACSLSGSFRAADPAFRGTSALLRDQSSPALNARPDGPPMLVVVGANDQEGRASALDYADALRSANQPNRVDIVDGAGHDWALWNNRLVPCLQWALQAR